MKGPIQKFKSHLGLNRKKVRKGEKRYNKPGSVYRDYRGTMGVVEDAVKGKKK